jgi:hypothetical protein
MRKLVAVFTVLFFSVGIATADEFSATIKKVDGAKVTLNKSTKDNPVKDETLNAVKDVKVFETKVKIEDDGDGNATLKIERAEVKDGLKNKMFEKEVKVRVKTDDKNNIIEINIQKGGIFQLGGIDLQLDGFDFQIEPGQDPVLFNVGALDEFRASIKKVDGNKVTINKSTKDTPVKDETLNAAKDVKVFQKTLKLVDDGNGGFGIEFEDVEVKDGLKSKIFEKEVKARIKTDDKTKAVTEIHIQQNIFQLDGLDLDLDGLQFDFRIEPIDPTKV